MPVYVLDTAFEVEETAGVAAHRVVARGSQGKRCLYPSGSNAGRVVAVTTDAAEAGRAVGVRRLGKALVEAAVHCWGRNSFGQVGDGTRDRRFLPTRVTGLSSAVGIAAGGDHTCALHHDGTVSCWGRNEAGQVVNDTTHDQPTPVRVTGLTTAVALAAGADHACALRADGTVRCWGSNSSGQLGDGPRTDRRTPVGGNGLTTAAALAAGGSPAPSPADTRSAHTCALRVDGAPVCWGENASGQLGLLLGWVWFGLSSVAFGGRLLRSVRPPRRRPLAPRVKPCRPGKDTKRPCIHSAEEEPHSHEIPVGFHQG